MCSTQPHVVFFLLRRIGFVLEVFVFEGDDAIFRCVFPGTLPKLEGVGEICGLARFPGRIRRAAFRLVANASTAGVKLYIFVRFSLRRRESDEDVAIHHDRNEILFAEEFLLAIRHRRPSVERDQLAVILRRRSDVNHRPSQISESLIVGIVVVGGFKGHGELEVPSDHSVLIGFGLSNFSSPGGFDQLSEDGWNAS